MDEILKTPARGTHLSPSLRRSLSIVVPWIGFSFSNLIKLVEPRPGEIRRFQSYFDPQQMPQAKYAGIDFPMSKACAWTKP